MKKLPAAPSYRIEALCFYRNPSIEPYTESFDTRYESRELALKAAWLLALKEAKLLGKENRKTVGAADACSFEADDDNENDGYDYIVRCWDGDDYRPVTKYKVVEDI